MKKSFFVFIIGLLFLLVGCGSNNNNNNNNNEEYIPNQIDSNVKFLHFIDDKGNTLMDYELNQYFNIEDLENNLSSFEKNYYKIGNCKYLDGSEFSINRDSINSYLYHNEADLTIEKWVLFFKNDCPAWTVVADLVPIDYNITYMNIEDATFEGVTTYNIESNLTLAIPQKKYYGFGYWYYNGIDEGREVKFLVNKLPHGIPRDITLYAYWYPLYSELEYSNIPDEIYNPNTDEKFYHKDGKYQLKPIKSTDAYEFKGWKLNDEYITYIDPDLLWDSDPTKYE